jgi:hypothetical protein
MGSRLSQQCHQSIYCLLEGVFRNLQAPAITNPTPVRRQTAVPYCLNLEYILVLVSSPQVTNLLPMPVEWSVSTYHVLEVHKLRIVDHLFFWRGLCRCRCGGLSESQLFKVRCQKHEWSHFWGTPLVLELFKDLIYHCSRARCIHRPHVNGAYLVLTVSME